MMWFLESEKVWSVLAEILPHSCKAALIARKSLTNLKESTRRSSMHTRRPVMCFCKSNFGRTCALAKPQRERNIPSPHPYPKHLHKSVSWIDTESPRLLCQKTRLRKPP